MTAFFGDYDTTETVYIPFNTFDSNDPSASVTATTLLNTDCHVHKDGSVTQRTSSSGETLSIDFDGVTGNHLLALDLSDNTDAGFYAAGSTYQVRIEGATVDGANINAWIGAFSIGRMLRPTTAGRTLDVTATGAAGIDWGNVENKTTANDLSATDIQLCDTTTTNTDMLTAAAVNAEVDTALSDIGLDHLISSALPTDWATDVAASSVFAELGGSGFVTATDSQQAIRDRGDAAWTTGAGGSPPDLLQSTTIATLASQTSFTLTAGSADDDAYNGAMVVVTDQSTSTQKAVGLVLDYTGATKTVTLDADPGVFTMAATDNIDIIGKLASSGASAAAIADAVWDEAATGHTDAGKAGEQLWTDIDAVLVDTDSLVTTVGAAGAGLTAINLPNQTMDITGNLSGNVGSVTGGVTLADGVEHGGTTATLRLGAAGATPAFYVTNSGGDAARFEVTASAGNGLHVMANGGSAGFFAEGGSTGFGMKARGYGGLAGLSISGGPTGAGLEVEGGSTSGDAVSLTATSGVGINAPDGITGDITGNLSGSVGSVTGHTAQTGDTYALANGAAGFVAIDTVVDAVKVKTDQMVFTKANELDANTQSINGAAVVGDGNATPWDGA